jgi:hypothetical protein
VVETTPHLPIAVKNPKDAKFMIVPRIFDRELGEKMLVVLW